ncbi:MAG: lytic transglycosylase domain-containing protein [Bacteroidetes bacterium]|nr:lytic transglycosylase domain-containing protein [Bacteroidota bacterium]
MKNTVLPIVQLLIILVLIGYILYGRTKENNEAISDPVIQSSTFEARTNYKVFTFDLPANIQFAGEEVPLYQSDVLERLDKEIHTNIYWNTSTVFLIKRSNRWLPQVEKILLENNIPSDFKYLPVIESGLQNVVSPKNAVGYWQILRATGRELGLEISREVDERYDPIKSTQAACKYLIKAYEKFGNWTNAAASYNMGMRGLSNRIDEQKVDSYYDLLLNDETSRYLFRILALKEIMENPEKYGYEIPVHHLYKQESLQQMLVEQNIKSLVDFALDQGINYKTLKIHNPWLRSNSLTIKRKGNSYTLLIPQMVKQDSIPLVALDSLNKISEETN